MLAFTAICVRRPDGLWGLVRVVSESCILRASIRTSTRTSFAAIHGRSPRRAIRTALHHAGLPTQARDRCYRSCTLQSSDDLVALCDVEDVYVHHDLERIAGSVGDVERLRCCHRFFR